MSSALETNAPLDAVGATNANADAILDAAEELFAQKGFAAVSMRLIATTSGQHLASANYYFGSKTGLFEAVFLRLIVPVNKRRLALLEERTSKKSASISDVVEAYIRPLYEDGIAGPKGRKTKLIMMFSKQVLSNPEEHKYLQNYYEDVARSYVQQIQRLVPGISLADAIWAYNYMISILVFTLAGRATTAKIPDELLTGIDPREPNEVTIIRLTRFICAGIQSLGKSRTK